MNETPEQDYNLKLLTLIDAYLRQYGLSRDELKTMMQRVLQRRWLPTRANVLSTLSTVQPPRQAEMLQTFAYGALSPLTMRAAGITSDVRRGAELRHLTPAPQPSLIPTDELLFTQKESSNFVVKYLYPPLVKRSLLYHPSTSNTFMGRSIYAASHIFVTRGDSGKKRLNASYFFGVLSLVAAHSARRPYWARSASAPFNDFGSTIGNDAGINLFHEFEPGIRQMVKDHTPRFAFKIEERITRNQNLKEVVASPAR